MKTRFTLSLLVALLSLTCWSTADEKPATTPEQTFVAFRDAFAAKDAAKVFALVTGTEEEMADLKIELEKTPAEMMEAIKSATVVDSHVEGDAAVCLVSMSKPEKVVRPMFMALKDGKWLMTKSAEGVSQDKVPALKKWAEERQKTLDK
jgi:hypothetical protein